ncbi:MAG: hypothetical protein QNL05_12050 [Gammaproteobacteria bacterium]|nr:hypothetical protein [Gammaproteobacteria bacterium]
MASYPDIQQHLPSLYRPDDDEDTLLRRFLQAAAATIDDAEREAGLIMQAHWFNYADDPRFNAFFNRYQALAQSPEETAEEQEQSLLNFNYIHDLAQVSTLFRLPPWKDAIGSGETVAHYRKRVAEIVRIYRHGLGTLSSLQQMIAAQLPDDSVDGKTQELAFTLQEFISAKRQLQPIHARGIPGDKPGPLMRWQLNNAGLLSTRPTVYILGIEADIHQDATERPLIELYSDNDNKPCRIGIAYEGNLNAGQALQLTPVYHSWLAGSNGLQQSSTEASDALPDISAPGPWETVPGTPAGEITKLLQVRDHTLWAVIDNTLQTFDGNTWQQRLTGLPDVHCLIEHEDRLLIGTAMGLLNLPLYPQDEIFTLQPAIVDLDGIAVHYLCQLSSGIWWAATDEGVRIWDESVSNTSLSELAETAGLPVYHIYEDNSGTIQLATESGAMQYQPAFKQWYIFVGGESSDSAPDWKPFSNISELPAADEIFLPAVNRVLRSRNASLWFASRDGIACYRASALRNFAYRTHLSAFPQLNTGNVSHIEEDQSGALWFTCDNGLLRFDGQHWQQLQGNELIRIHSVDATDSQPWRYQRDQAQWQVYDASSLSWMTSLDAPLLNEEDTIYNILWSSSAQASLGTWDGHDFIADDMAIPSPLRMRYKPVADGETRIVDGGIPALPALPTGNSTWRYLRVEGGDAESSPNRPNWTCEGRLLPPPEEPTDIEEGRFSSILNPLSEFNDAVFAYKPSAQVWFSWQSHQPLTLQTRLQTTENQIDPNVLDRVWEGIQQVRPAGAHVELIVNNNIVRGEPNG